MFGHTPLGRMRVGEQQGHGIGWSRNGLCGFAGSRGLLREADLGKHLDNPTDKDAGKAEVTPVPSKVEIKKPSKTNGSAVEAEENPRELVSKSDYQLQQAFSVLKVQQLLMNKPAAK